VRRAGRRAGFAGGAALALAGAIALGVALGHSAIAEINPVHYRDPEPVRAVPEPAPPPPDAFASAYDWPQGYAALAADCGGDCDRREARETRLAFEEPSPPALASRDPPPAAEPPPWPPGSVGDPGHPLDLYAHYPIEQKRTTPAPEDVPPPIEDDSEEAGH
jgi:hypothetical protein